MSLDNDKVTEYLKNYRSYRYAANNCPVSISDPYMSPPNLLQRSNRGIMNVWDSSRYHNIVNMIEGAVNDVLSDDERTVIMRKYMDRNTLNLKEIADVLHKDQSTISRWHTAAIRRLAIAFMPLSTDEKEIDPFNHMFDDKWKFEETYA